MEPAAARINLPEWMIPETAAARRGSGLHHDHTRDNGTTWTPSTTSSSYLSRVRMSAKGFGLALIEFTDTFSGLRSFPRRGEPVA
jgi:hypothetical protein